MKYLVYAASILGIFGTDFCHAKGRSPSQHDSELSKENLQRLVETPQKNRRISDLKVQTYKGCVTVPDRSNPAVGSRFTKEPCSVEVFHGNRISVSFIDKTLPLFLFPDSDLYFSNFNSNKVLLVQHDLRGEVLDVTQTIFDSQNIVIYGRYKGDKDDDKHIKSCHIPPQFALKRVLEKCNNF